MSESETLMKKYPGMNKEMADQIANDTDPNRKANIIAMVEQTFKLSEKGKSGDEIIEIFKNSNRTKQADGGITQLRNGYYGGGQAMVEPDLSDIGHGSDALMARTRITAPGSQATTSTGLNYLLGEDNDNIRVPFNEGLLVPPKKPVPPANPFNELMRIYKTYEEAMPGVSKDTQQYLQNDFKEKLNNAKISVEEFMTYRMQNNFADGGRIGFAGGGRDASTSSFSQSFDNQHGTNTASRANKSVDRQQAQGQAQADATNARIANTDLGREQAFNNYIGVNYPNQNPNNKTLGQKIGYGIGSFFNNPYVRTYATIGSGGFSEKLRQMMMAKKAYDNKDIFQDEIIEDEIRNIPIIGGITSEYADGGITGLRQGYVGGGGVNLARRGFLKLAGATVASVAALKTGLVKILGKTAATAVPKMVTIPAGSGAPAWFEGMVNKVLADGIDITKKASTLDGQVVKSLDTPTGKVDVTFDTRTGSIDAFYKGENTALGESVDMRYTVGQADEGTKIKPADEFEAVEAVPEMQGFNVDDTELAFGENVVSDVRGLYSDTSELAELGGQKVLIKDIAESIQKKRVLKDMSDDSMGFANEVLERTGIAADPPHSVLTKMRYHSD